MIAKRTMLKNLLPSERELLITQTAVARSESSELGSGVVLIPSNKLLCQCDEDKAKLIVKLFNQGPGIADTEASVLWP